MANSVASGDMARHSPVLFGDDFVVAELFAVFLPESGSVGVLVKSLSTFFVSGNDRGSIRSGPECPGNPTFRGVLDYRAGRDARHSYVDAVRRTLSLPGLTALLLLRLSFVQGIMK